METYVLDTLQALHILLEIKQDTRQTCLLLLWTSKGKTDIKQIITYKALVFKRHCRGSQGHDTLGGNLQLGAGSGKASGRR